MGIICNLILSVLHLLLVVVDVVMIAVIVRALFTRFSTNRWLASLNALGSPLVDPVLNRIPTTGANGRRIRSGVLSILLIAIFTCVRMLVNLIVFQIEGWQ